MESARPGRWPPRPRIGAVVLPEYGWDEARHIWARLDQLGLHHAWTFDHLSWRSLRDAPWYDSLTTLTAAACVTSRIRLGTLVATPNFRHPVVLAKQVMTLDQVSAGRLILGLGAGAEGSDATVLGQPELSGRQRADRFSEFVTLMDLLLRQRVTTYRGGFFTALEARMVPGCVQRPRVPFAVSATGPRGYELAARQAGWWVTIGGTRDPGGGTEEENWRLLERQLARLAEVCEQECRDAASIGKLVNLSRVIGSPYRSPQRFADAVGRCGELGFTDVVVSYPRHEGVFSGDVGAFEAAVLGVLN